MNSKRIFQIRALAVVFVSVVGLTACGGGGGGPVNSGSQVNVVPPSSGSNVRYGAVYSYYENGNKLFAYWQQRDTKEEIRNAALSRCREDSEKSRCEIETTYTNCVALAQSDDRSVEAYATGNSLASARSSAREQCRESGGTGCADLVENGNNISLCIIPVTSQAAQSGGFNNTSSAPSEPSGGNARFWGVVYSVPDPAPFRYLEFFIDRGSEAEVLSYIGSDNDSGICNQAGLDCRAEVTFTNCFGIAVAGRLWSPSNSYGYVGIATANSRAIADELALEKCRELGGDEHPDPEVQCNAIQYAQACNTVITPQTSKVKGILHTTYGSVAIESYTGIFSEYEYRTLAVAHSAGRNTYGSAPRDVGCVAGRRCEVQEEFDFTNCFALASDGSIFSNPLTPEVPELTYTAFASSNTLSGAESLALEQCRRFGRSSDCSVGGHAPFSLQAVKGCNIPITPQPSKVMGVRHRVSLDSQQE